MTKRGPETHHVVPNSQKGGWDVVKGGSQRASGHFDTKQQAVDAGREISKNQGTEFRIHNANGQIASSDSHGNDPKNIRG